MNVALIIDDLAAGGAEGVVALLARGLAARGHHAHVYCLKSAAAPAALLEEPGVIVREAGSHGFDPTLSWTLGRWLRSDAIDIAHAHSSAALVLTLPASRMLGIPLIQTRHGTLLGNPTRHRRLADTLARFVDRTTIVSESLRATLPAAIAHGSPHVPNGVDLTPVPSEQARTRLEQLCGRTLNGPVVLSVGTISPEKDTCGLLRAFAILRRTEPAALLVYIGTARDPAYRARVHDLCRREHLDDYVHWAGQVEHAWQYLSGADVFCLASRTEAAPLCILEAMSQHVPIVATAVGDVGSLDRAARASRPIVGTTRLIQDGHNGLLVPSADAPALAEALRTALADPAAARQRAETAAGDYERCHTAERMTHRYERLYMNCLDDRRGGVNAMSEAARRGRPRKPRVLMLGPAPPAIGGMVSVIDGLMGGRLGERFDLLRFTGQTPALERQKRLDDKQRPRRRMARSFKLIRSLARHMTALARLMRVMTTRRINLLHIHTCSDFSFHRGLADLLTARLLGRRVVLHIHGGQFDRFCERSGRLGRAIIRRGCEAADAVVVLSDRWRDRIAPYAGRARLDVIPNGIELARTEQAGSRPSSARRTGNMPCRFVFIGRLTRRKGLRELLEAAESLRRENIGFELLIAGPDSGPHEPNWIEHVRLVGLDQQVSFVGTVAGRTKRELLVSADCLVLPSHVEGLPIVVLEAAALRVPVIATEVGSTSDLLTSSEPDGAVRQLSPLVPPRDAEALAAQMIRLAGDASLRREMGRNLYAHVARHFNAEIQAERLGRLYAGILSYRPMPQSVSESKSSVPVQRRDAGATVASARRAAGSHTAQPLAFAPTGPSWQR